MIWTRQERKRILADDPKMKMNEVSKAVSFFLYFFVLLIWVIIVVFVFCVGENKKLLHIRFRWEKDGRR